MFSGSRFEANESKRVILVRSARARSHRVMSECENSVTSKQPWGSEEDLENFEFYQILQ